MAPRLCEEQQILLSNNMKYSDFIAGKYFFQNYYYGISGARTGEQK